MNELTIVNVIALPVFFGLVGFLEPCSIGSTLLMVKQLEGRTGREKVAQMLIFSATRGVVVGLLGLLAALVGSAFLGWQKAAWLLLGAFYVVLGALYLFGLSGALMRAIGPGLHRLRSTRGTVAIGMLLGINIPACAAPLILALLALAAAGGASAAEVGAGFVSLGLFGLALSLPLVLAVLVPRFRALIDRLAALSRQVPRWTGALLVVLGVWSIWFGLFVSIGP